MPSGHISHDESTSLAMLPIVVSVAKLMSIPSMVRLILPLTDPIRELAFGLPVEKMPVVFVFNPPPFQYNALKLGVLHPVVGLFGLSSTISVAKMPEYPTKMRVHCPSVDCITLHLFETSVPAIHCSELATVNSSVAVGRAVVLPPENPLMEVRMVKFEGV